MTEKINNFDRFRVFSLSNFIQFCQLNLTRNVGSYWGVRGVHIQIIAFPNVF